MVRPSSVSQTRQQQTNFVDALRIKTIRRFVENYEFGMRQERLRDAQSLPHSVRVRAHRIARAIAQTNQVERFLDLFSGLAPPDIAARMRRLSQPEKFS